MREEGYYWVKLRYASEWEIAYYSTNVGWSIEGRHYDSDEFRVIHNDRIKKPVRDINIKL